MELKKKDPPDDWNSISLHEFCTRLPAMSDDEMDSLTFDINANGLREPIVLFGGQILDGRHRFQACKRLNKTPEFVEFNGSAEQAVAYVTSENFSRRHLNQSQRAMYLLRSGIVDSGGKVRELARRYGVSHVTLYKALFVWDRDKELAEVVLNGGISVAKAEARLRDATAATKVAQPHLEILEKIKRIGSLVSSGVEPQAKSKIMRLLEQAEDVLTSSRQRDA